LIVASNSSFVLCGFRALAICIAKIITDWDIFPTKNATRNLRRGVVEAMTMDSAKKRLVPLYFFASACPLPADIVLARNLFIMFNQTCFQSNFNLLL